ncbi:acyltransferase family protein [Microcoleus sp. FACHB-672]|uniref:acyltransferase family protein n=1 Tax=Microcoleus sp. FACHB-672 TaxID=2692825 RepID=UPI001684CC26|nr:acyltransferase [Microcoleus sp. FACHB-672]MBD2040799.1 acyltransferase [Microcoleus sp. FACHB-672]
MISQTLPPNYQRLSQLLPAFKGWAIFTIVTYHLWGYSKGWLLFSQVYTASLNQGIKGLLEAVLNIFCLLGEYGVHIFIIASGFGLASSWWRGGKGAGNTFRIFDILKFWRRRLWRLFPLYWLAHGLALILAWVQPAWVPFGREVLNRGGFDPILASFASFTTLRNFSLDYYFFLNAAWWYVGLAVQLYLIFPLLVWVGKRWGWSSLLIISLVITLLYRTLIIGLSLNEIATDVLLRGAFFPTRLFGFVFGIVLAVTLLEPAAKNFQGVCRWSQKLLLEKRWIWLTALMWVVGVGFDWASSEGWMVLRIPADILIGVGEFCLLFQTMSLIPWGKAGLATLGNLSYGIYLSHMNFMVALWAILTPLLSFYWLRFFIVVAITCGLGGLFDYSYRLLSQKTSLKISS